MREWLSVLRQGIVRATYPAFDALRRARVGPAGWMVSTAAPGFDAPGRAFAPRVAPAPVPRAHPVYLAGGAEDAKFLRRHAEVGSDTSEIAGLITLEGARLMMPISIAIIHGRWIRELFHDDEALAHPLFVWELARARLSAPRGRIAAGTLLTLPAHTNYCHWTLDIMPRLVMFDNESELAAAPLLAPERLPPFALEWLDRLGLSERVCGLADGVWSVDQLVAPTRLAQGFDVTSAQLDWISSVFANETAGAIPHRRIFVSRRDVARRPLANEADLAPVLKRFGVETVTLTGMSVAAQARLFAEAELVVGPHGAGFTNFVFSQPGATLIEIFPENYFYKKFGALAAAAGCRYGFVIAPSRGLAHVVDPVTLEAVLTAWAQDFHGIGAPRGRRA